MVARGDLGAQVSGGDGWSGSVRGGRPPPEPLSGLPKPPHTPPTQNKRLCKPPRPPKPAPQTAGNRQTSDWTTAQPLPHEVKPLKTPSKSPPNYPPPQSETGPRRGRAVDSKVCRDARPPAGQARDGRAPAAAQHDRIPHSHARRGARVTCLREWCRFAFPGLLDRSSAPYAPKRNNRPSAVYQQKVADVADVVRQKADALMLSGGWGLCLPHLTAV